MRMAFIAILSMILVSLAAGPVFANGQQDSTGGSAPASAGDTLTRIPLPIVKTPVTFTYWVGLNPASLDVLKDWNDTLSMKELERKTGIHIRFIHPNVGQEVQAFNLMVASGDLPDMIQEREPPMYYPGGGDKAISDGVYRDLNALVDAYAPNYKKVLARGGAGARLTLTDTGKRWGMFHVTEGAEPAWTGYVVRKDWLDELGLAVPVTLDDWEKVLTAFKTRKGCTSPLLVYNTGVPVYNHIISAFDIGNSFYQVNGKVMFGPVQAAYKDYLTLMNRWYTKGLLDKDFMGRTDAGFQVMAPTNLVATGKAGMFPTIWGRTANAYIMLGNVKDAPGFFLQAVPSPRRSPSQKIHFNYPSYEVREGTAITSACKDPKTAMMWLDYMYSPEGSAIINYGREGETFTMKDGKALFTDMIIKPSEGITPLRALQKYCRWDGPGIVDYKRMWQVSEASGQGQMLKALQVWDKDGIDWVLPPVTLTQEEAAENANLMPDITTYVNEMTVKFIIGVEPLSGFPSFVKQIKSMNIERATQIQQTALTRFNARK